MDTDKVIQHLKIEKAIRNKKGTGKHEGSTQPMAGKDVRLSAESV